LRRTLDKYGLIEATMGLEFGPAYSIRMISDEMEALRSAIPAATLVDSDEPVGRSRMVKSPLEIERIREAVEITEVGFLEAFLADRQGMTKRDLARFIASEWLRKVLRRRTTASTTNTLYFRRRAFSK